MTATDEYHPEWLAYEAAIGSRPAMTGDIEKDVPMFNHIGVELAKLWKPLNKEPEIINETLNPENIPIRIYKPQDENEESPLVIFFHGGGYISGNLDTEDSQCRYLASNAPCILVSVDYPLGPATQMPDIIKSAVASVQRLLSREPPLTSGKVIIAGGSAGGSLATQVIYSLIESGDISKIAGLVLMFPFMTYCGKYYTGPYVEEHTSYQEKATGYPFISTPILESAHERIGLQANSPAHCVLLADRSILSQFPRTYVTTAEHDPCRDDGKILVKRLTAESENGAREDHYKKFPHYFHWFPTVPSAYTVMEKTVEGLRWVVNGA